ncbi:hypothetical protein [Vibrio variabilis]|jgi:hypothetical protein|uniref:hypothetical protein n=1 Tax=Vibrio variabilis TaxID=990271 RepID=UPI000DDAE2BD|nr:hypothetical protein [Vibrio variabilis]
MIGFDSLTNSGSMPINAGGGAAAPSSSRSSNSSGQSVGGINMGGGVPTWLIVAGVVAVLIVWMRKK